MKLWTNNTTFFNGHTNIVWPIKLKIMLNYRSCKYFSYKTDIFTRGKCFWLFTFHDNLSPIFSVCDFSLSATNIHSFRLASAPSIHLNRSHPLLLVMEYLSTIYFGIHCSNLVTRHIHIVLRALANLTISRILLNEVFYFWRSQPLHLIQVRMFFSIFLAVGLTGRRFVTAATPTNNIGPTFPAGLQSPVGPTASSATARNAGAGARACVWSRALAPPTERSYYPINPLQPHYVQLFATIIHIADRIFQNYIHKYEAAGAVKVLKGFRKHISIPIPVLLVGLKRTSPWFVDRIAPNTVVLEF